MTFNKVIEKIKGVAEDAADNAKYHVEAAYQTSVDVAADVVDFTSAQFLKAYAGLRGTYEAIKYAGLTISLITAPVPTIVALAVMWLMELSIDSVKNDIETELENKNKKREFDRVVKLLKKYGKIPETAVVKTEFIKMEINPLSGKIDGHILKGKLEGALLSDISDETLSELIAKAPDEDTEALLKAFISYKHKLSSLEKRS